MSEPISFATGAALAQARRNLALAKLGFQRDFVPLWEIEMLVQKVDRLRREHEGKDRAA